MSQNQTATLNRRAPNALEAGFMARLAIYAFFFIPLYLVGVWLMLMSDAEWTKSGLTGVMIIDS